jgi:hypothetical protein
MTEYRWKGQVILSRADAKVIYDWYVANTTLENTTDAESLVFGRLCTRVKRFGGAVE